MSVPKNTTPRPFSHLAYDPTPAEGDTPPWINDWRHSPDRPTPPLYGKPARKTVPMAQRLPLNAQVRIPTLEPCWDCHGRGTMAGSSVVVCRICGQEWTKQQARTRGGNTMQGFQLPCTHVIRGRRFDDITWVEAECPICTNQDKRAHPFQTDPGYLPNWRTMEELYQWFYQRAAEDEEMTEEMRAAHYQQSEPTAPAAPLEHMEHMEHPAVRIPERFTPHVTPLAPDEF